MHQTRSAYPFEAKTRTQSFPFWFPSSSRQASLCAQFDTFAHAQEDVSAVAHEGCRVAAEGVGTRFATLLQYRADTRTFVLQAGIGCPAGMVGRNWVAVSRETTAGLAWLTGQLIHFRCLDGIGRIQVPKAMRGHGVCRMVSVPIQGEEHNPLGVLEVGSPDAGEFALHDLLFLHALAQSMAAAVDRHSGLMRWADQAAKALEHGRTPILGGRQQDVQIGTC